MILCIGTTPTVQRTMIFERIVIDDVNRSAEVYEYASGKSVNVARVAKTFGKRVVATGFVGGDRGKFLREQVAREGIEERFIEVGPQTRLCTTVVDKSTALVTELVEESAKVEDDAWPKIDAAIDAAIGEANVVVCSGSLPPGGPADFYARRVRGKGNARVIVDARGITAREAITAGPCILKLNRDELAATTGMKTDTARQLRDAMRAALPVGGAVVVTLGKDGAAAMVAEKVWRLHVPKVNVVSAIGSGDSFAAGMAVALHDGGSIAEACRLGAACGAANAMTPRAGEVRLEDVKRILDEITLEAE